MTHNTQMNVEYSCDILDHSYDTQALEVAESWRLFLGHWRPIKSAGSWMYLTRNWREATSYLMDLNKHWRK